MRKEERKKGKEKVRTEVGHLLADHNTSDTSDDKSEGVCDRDDKAQVYNRKKKRVRKKKKKKSCVEPKKARA